ncbi:hypothetical protein [Aromatoleum diolicum]|uniref:Cytochrome oxidase subunit I profile domain-containing protein n=1 Tax=Aromatoleum diolicum TaxID=75796 RepID=A0ABX1QEA4_9RHOO|nr:hypothetical protein [Aromatoleum diolicum]NMG75736.1 hypothetical protein [Aromatoleum diolicum]
MAAATQPLPTVSQYWLLLAVSSLGLSALAALVLVLARTPVLTTLVAPDIFPRALVVHVNLATLIWYLSMAGALWTEALPERRRVTAMAAFFVAGAGALGVIATGFAAPGTPILANYVPYLQNAIFVGSLASFAAGGLATAMISFTRPRDTAEWGFMIARWPFFMGSVYLLLNLQHEAPLIDALWGTGHVLQFGFVTLLMAIWLRLAERAGARPPPAPLAIALFAAASAPATLAPLLQITELFDQGALHAFHTQLMRWANWPAPLFFGLILLRGGRAVLRADGFAASIALFVIGIVAGAAIDNQTTMIPAHYHGTIGAFTLALMAAVLARVTPVAHAHATPEPSRRPLMLYAGGIIALISGLAWSGTLGAPRKMAFSAEGADLPSILAAALTGAGGAVTIIGVGLFVTIAAPRIVRLCKTRPQQSSSPEPPAVASTFAAVR